jgi:hypothetical protein
MDKRQASETFTNMINNGSPAWAATAEENWVRINEMTY